MYTLVLFNGSHAEAAQERDSCLLCCLNSSENNKPAADKSVKVACKTRSISRLTNLEFKFKALFGTDSRLYLGVLKSQSLYNFTLASDNEFIVCWDVAWQNPLMW